MSIPRQLSVTHNGDNMVCMKRIKSARYDKSSSEKNMRYECSRKPEKCPACGVACVVEILYGLPAFFSEFEKDLNDGRITLGGCEITGDDPVWQCVACQTVVYRKRIGGRRKGMRPNNDLHHNWSRFGHPMERRKMASNKPVGSDSP